MLFIHTHPSSTSIHIRLKLLRTMKKEVGVSIKFKLGLVGVRETVTVKFSTTSINCHISQSRGKAPVHHPDRQMTHGGINIV